MKAPVVSGTAFRALVGLLESPLASLALGNLMRGAGYEVWKRTSPGLASPIQVPLSAPAPIETRPPSDHLASLATRTPVVVRGGALEPVSAFVEEFASRGADPTTVARRVIRGVEELEAAPNALGLFIAHRPDEVLAAAEASASRHRRGEPRSVLDGVPVVVKDELDVAGFPTTLGTSYLTKPAARDSTVVERLTAAGAVIIGKANMNELGISPLGINPHHGTARNPWNRHHHTGGSSSGPAAAVAAGLCPVAIGADGGGSIRIPASLCGVVGLKATFGRISEAGVPPLCWNVAHVGPLGLTIADVAAAYAIIAGPDPREPTTLSQPAVHLTDFDLPSLHGLRLGIARAFFETAAPAVVVRCKEAVQMLVEAGAQVVELPAPDLNLIRWTHTCIILSEMLAAVRDALEEDSRRFALSTRQSLALARQFSGADVVHAMRHRHALTRQWLELLTTCDVVVTPTTAVTAPPYVEASLPEGRSEFSLIDSLMRFIRLGNLTGFPALSLPAGYDEEGLPVGLQLMGRPYEEHLLFRLGRVVEANVVRRVPPIHKSLLGPGATG